MASELHSSSLPRVDHIEESSNSESTNIRSAIQAFEKLGVDTTTTNARKPSHVTKRRWCGPLGRSMAANRDTSMPEPVKGDEELVKVSVLLTQDTGYYKISPSTTFLELREQIATRLGHNNFGFQDLTTKKVLSSEDRSVRALKQPITVAQAGMDNLLADATFQGGPNTTITREGAAFRVFWWDSLLNTRRLVWLRMEPHRLVVSNAGSFFKLFDANGLRNPLVFAGVKGSDKGFQLVKGGSRLASRFYAQSVEQKQIISIYFCFVWRPNAVRRGWLPRAELDGQAMMENGKDPLDPRQFVNLLRRHMIEVDRVVQEIERSMDSKLVHYYIALFAQMFTGGYALREEGGLLGAHPLSASELQSFGKASKLMQDWQEKANRNRALKEQRDREAAEEAAGKYGPNSPSKKHKASTEESIDFDEFFDESGDPFDFVAGMAQALGSGAEGGPAGMSVGADGVPLPPPPPPPGAGPLVQKPPICPINFDGISANDISGTIWAEMTTMSLKEKELGRLESYLKILFGRDARDRSLKKEDTNDGIIETGRLRNLEVLLFMEELKGLSNDELIDLILNFDNRIFCPSVLERLVRKVSREDPGSSGGSTGPTYAFLPSSKESESLLAHHNKHGKETLRPGELFFLELTQRVPDRMQRFEFGYFMSKVESEMPSIEEQLDIVEDADRVVRESQRFKAALKIILDILNTLMPRFGLTRGFRISSFVSSVDRVTGSVANPSDGREPENEESAADSIAPYLDPSLPEAQRKRLLKLATLRKKIVTKDADSWKVNLNEFISIFMNRFEVCQGFWTDIIEACESAMRVDQAAIEVQTSDWITQIELIRAYYDEASSSGSSRPRDAFVKTVGKFLDRSTQIETMRKRAVSVRSKTESLWRWMGEVMGGDPSLIFKYIHDLSEVFKKQWKALEAQWDHRRTMVLRGALRLEKPPSSSSKQDSSSSQDDNIKNSAKSKAKPKIQLASAADSKIAAMQKILSHAESSSEASEPSPSPQEAQVTFSENEPTSGASSTHQERDPASSLGRDSSTTSKPSEPSASSPPPESSIHHKPAPSPKPSPKIKSRSKAKKSRSKETKLETLQSHSDTSKTTIRPKGSANPSEASTSSTKKTKKMKRKEREEVEVIEM